MNVGRIRGFLLQIPKPAALRVTRDGEAEELKFGKSFQKTAESVAAYGAELVECLDGDGKLLRAMRLDDSDAQRSDAAPIPAGLATDPHALMLTHFANLLHRAYEHSTETAFTKLVDVMERMNDRSDAIEQRLERTEAANRRLLQDQVDDAFDRAQEVADKAAEGENPLVDQMAAAFLNGKMQPKQNGAARPPAPKGQS